MTTVPLTQLICASPCRHGRRAGTYSWASSSTALRREALNACPYPGIRDYIVGNRPARSAFPAPGSHVWTDDPADDIGGEALTPMW
jgi:hypothetical protein